MPNPDCIKCGKEAALRAAIVQGWVCRTCLFIALDKDLETKKEG